MWRMLHLNMMVLYDDLVSLLYVVKTLLPGCGQILIV
jgi:hypothetical protein